MECIFIKQNNEGAFELPPREKLLELFQMCAYRRPNPIFYYDDLPLRMWTRHVRSALLVISDTALSECPAMTSLLETCQIQLKRLSHTAWKAAIFLEWKTGKDCAGRSSVNPRVNSDPEKRLQTLQSTWPECFWVWEESGARWANQCEHERKYSELYVALTCYSQNA